MTTTTLNARKAAALFLVFAMLSGCAKPESAAKHIIVGGVIGAGVGVATMVATGGCVGCGAALGAAVGAGIGGCFDVLENKR